MATSFSCGDVIYIEKVSYTDHPKLHLVLSISENLFFVINSDINSTIAFNNDFRICQIECTINDPNKKLSKSNGYIACHEIADEIFSIEIESKIQKGEAINFGKLDDETLNKVLEVMKNHCSPTIIPHDKKIIIQNLEQILNKESKSN